MAKVEKWNPFGVALDVEATVDTVERTSATQYTVKINVAWEVSYSGNKTNYGMKASSGGETKTISAFDGTNRSSGSNSLTGTYSISGNGKQTKTITVTFENFKTDNNDSATKSITLSVSVPAWTSYKVTYNANGGSNPPSEQTKWKDQSLTLSSTKPTRTGYTFNGWNTKADGTGTNYAAGATYTSNATVTLYAKWKANTYTVSYNGNGDSVTNVPGNQTKTYGTTLTLSSTKPTRANYTFKGWGTSAGATTVAYSPGDSYTKNEKLTLYAIWELGYAKPRITNFSVTRCDESGDAAEEGQYADIDLSWQSDLPVESIILRWKSTTSNLWNTLDDDLKDYSEGSTTSGSVDKIIGGSFSASSSYIVEVTVEDSNGSTTEKLTINSLNFTIHAKEGGNGVAFGKTAEIDDTADFNFSVRLRKPMIMENGKQIIGLDSSGIQRIALQPVTASNITVLGYGLYLAKIGATHIYGNNINFFANNGVSFNNNVMLGEKTGYHDGKTGVYINKAGYMHLQRATTDGNPYIGFYVDSETSADSQIICKREENTAKEIGYDKYLYFSGADRYAFDHNVQTQKSLYIGLESTSSAYAIITKWKDNANHNLVERFADGLTSAFGWVGSSTYATITKIRGQTCQYQNAAGSTTLSDERLKKDFTNLDKWSAFYDSLEPIAFKMKNGNSGRYHIGFKAQQVEQALTDAGLTTQDFAGFVKTKYTADSDDPEGSKVYEEAGIKPGDDEYGLIYTEFVALNTYEIQKLRKKNDELEKRVESLEERLKALESLLNK